MTTKKSASGVGSIRKKTVVRNGKSYTYWEARYTVGYDPGTGKQIQRSISGKTQREVREKLQTAAVHLTEGTYNDPSKTTLGQWLDTWTAEYLLRQKYRTVQLYKATVKNHIKPGLGAIRLSALTPMDIQKFYNRLLRDGKLGRAGKSKSGEPLSAKTVRNIHGVLTKALNQAVDVGLIRQNPADRITVPKAVRSEITPLTDEQVRAYLEAAGQDEYGPILKVILFTGLRESEAIGLTWDCVDFETGTLTIKQQLQQRPARDGGYVLAPLKNDKVRVLTPASYVMDILKRQRVAQMEARFRAAEFWEGWKTEAERKTWFVFTGPLGRHLVHGTVYDHHKRIAASIGAEYARVHDLRHTFAVLSLQNGDDIKTVQENLGHATAAFTLDVYGHVSEKMRRDSADRMQAYIEDIK